MSLPVKPEHLETQREWERRTQENAREKQRAAVQRRIDRQRAELLVRQDGNRTTIRREPKPLRRKAVKPVSEKRAAQLAEYRPKRDAFLAERPFCERCGRPRTCLHHKRGRRGLLLLDERWWAASCTECNDLPESQTGLARAEGWLLDQFGLIPDDDSKDAA